MFYYNALCYIHSFMIWIQTELNHFFTGDTMEDITYTMWKKDRNLFNFWQMDYLGGLFIVFIRDLKYYIVIRLLMLGKRSS